jgi:hypothetical protein
MTFTSPTTLTSSHDDTAATGAPCHPDGDRPATLGRLTLVEEAPLGNPGLVFGCHFHGRR